jgi:hypothetical protein
MKSILSKIVGCGAGFILILVSGVATSNAGKPYNPALFGLHKIAAVGTIVLLVVIVRNLARTVELRALTPAVFVITGLLFIALVVSGALLSLSIAPEVVLRVHQVVPLLAIGFSALSIYLLIGGKALARIGAVQ